MILESVMSDALSPTARYPCDVFRSLELCRPDFMPRRWTPPFVTRENRYNEDCFNFLQLMPSCVSKLKSSSYVFTKVMLVKKLNCNI